jgi:hypothetical protein
LELYNYAVIVPIENSSIMFNNQKINSLPSIDIDQNYRIPFDICTNITYKFRTIAIYWKALAKKTVVRIKLVGMSMIFHCTKLNLSKRNISWVVSIKRNVNLNFQPPAIFAFLCFAKVASSCSSFKDLRACKISRFHVGWCNFVSTSAVLTSVILEWLKLRN